MRTRSEIINNPALKYTGRVCAVCGKEIIHSDLCNKCFKEYVIDGIIPDWLKELIKMQSSFDRKECNHEPGYVASGLTEEGDPRINVTVIKELKFT